MARTRLVRSRKDTAENPSHNSSEQGSNDAQCRLHRDGGRVGEGLNAPASPVNIHIGIYPTYHIFPATRKVDPKVCAILMLSVRPLIDFTTASRLWLQWLEHISKQILEYPSHRVCFGRQSICTSIHLRM